MFVLTIVDPGSEMGEVLDRQGDDSLGRDEDEAARRDFMHPFR